MTDTRREARPASGTATANRNKLMEAFDAFRSGLTADEAAMLAGLNVLAARPRITELKGDGKLRDTGERRLTSLGKKAAVLQMVVA